MKGREDGCLDLLVPWQEMSAFKKEKFLLIGITLLFFDHFQFPQEETFLRNLS